MSNTDQITKQVGQLFHMLNVAQLQSQQKADLESANKIQVNAEKIR